MPRFVALSVLNRFGIHAFDGLKVVAFALPPGPHPHRTGAYSFRLASNFGLGLRDWEAMIRRIDRPTTVLVGSRDELFYPDQFKPTLAVLQPAIQVTVVNGPDHMGMVLDDAALAAIVPAARTLLASAPTAHCTP